MHLALVSELNVNVLSLKIRGESDGRRLRSARSVMDFLA